MKAVIQRVSEAQVVVDEKIVASIQKGYLILLGVAPNDTQDDIKWLTKKISGLRIFSDQDGKMNLNINQVQGEIIVVSQFTLFASTKKGTRPSYIGAAPPNVTIPIYEKFVAALTQETEIDVQTGIFGADMKVSLCNDGPVTLTIDTHHKN